jgi:rubredoxin
MAPSNTSAERQPPLKATLYCPDCKHASHINGDWIIEVHADYLDYECPECGTIIESRGDGTSLSTQSDGRVRPGLSD